MNLPSERTVLPGKQLSYYSFIYELLFIYIFKNRSQLHRARLELTNTLGNEPSRLPITVPVLYARVELATGPLKGMNLPSERTAS